MDDGRQLPERNQIHCHDNGLLLDHKLVPQGYLTGVAILCHEGQLPPSILLGENNLWIAPL